LVIFFRDPLVPARQRGQGITSFGGTWYVLNTAGNR
jgi:hypothetical protein